MFNDLIVVLWFRNLANNKLEGPIPHNISSCTALNQLYVASRYAFFLLIITRFVLLMTEFLFRWFLYRIFH
jgi:hypothetical protein